MVGRSWFASSRVLTRSPREHLLLGLLVEDQSDWAQSLPMDAGEDSIGITVDAGARPAPFFSPDRAKTLRRVLAESAIPGTPKPDTLDMPVADGT